MAVTSEWEARRSPLWRRPDAGRHVNDLELASLDVMINMGAVRVPRSCRPEERITEGDVRHIISSALFVSNVDPAKIYAYLATGYLVTVENLANWSASQLTAWDQAISAYHESESPTA